MQGARGLLGAAGCSNPVYELRTYNLLPSKVGIQQKNTTVSLRLIYRVAAINPEFFFFCLLNGTTQLKSSRFY
jgi:hypothetical protein